VTSLGLYQPGAGPLHRLPAGLKFVATLAISILSFALHAPAWLSVLALAVVVAYAVGRISLRRCWRTARTLIPLTLFVFLFQWWLQGLDAAAPVCLRLLTTLACAHLFTLTTRIDDLISAVERALRPARRLGVRPERVGLLVGLTVQAIAALSVIASEVREAQQARDATRSVQAFAVPFLVRTRRHADELGEALAARGADDG
jgi:biotin transport system permease protein